MNVTVKIVLVGYIANDQTQYSMSLQTQSCAIWSLTYEQLAGYPKFAAVIRDAARYQNLWVRFVMKGHITYSSSVAHFQKRSSQSTPLTSLLEIASMKLMNA